jgi:hypothetical protein
MNIKPTDMHVALPKIMEPALNQMNQQPNQKQIMEQQQITNSMQNQTEDSLKKSNAVEETLGETIQDGQPRREQGMNSRNRKRKKEEDEKPATPQAADPFKGKHIDFKA